MGLHLPQMFDEPRTSFPTREPSVFRLRSAAVDVDVTFAMQMQQIKNEAKSFLKRERGGEWEWKTYRR